jgi:hypothetical protein
MRLDYYGIRKGILFFIAAVLTNYIGDILPPLDSIIKHILVDWIMIILFSIGIGFILYEFIRRLGIPETVHEPSPMRMTGHFPVRSDLRFDRMMSIAKNSVEMSALDFRIVVHQHMSHVRKLIHSGIRVTFLVLDAKSPTVETQARSLHAGADLKASICKTLMLLCKEKESLSRDKRNNLIIKTYDSAASHSIIIIDRDNPNNAWIKVEYRPEGSDSDSRPSEAHYKKDDIGFFSQYCSEYDNILEKSQDYICK